MLGAVAGVRVAASTIINCIACIVTIGLRFTHLCIDFETNGATEVVFENFLLMDKSVTCFKLFIGAYRQVHAEGVGLFAFSCLFGLSVHLFTVVIHLYMNHRSRIRAWISGMAIFVAAGAFMFVMKILEDYAWHSTAVNVILDVFVCLEAVLLVRNKMSEHGGNGNLLRDLIIISSETLINYCLFSYYLAKTDSPWDAEKILHLVGSGLSVVIGLGQIGWIAYKAYTHGFFTWGVETASGAAVDGGDVEQQVLEQCAKVEEMGGKTPPVFTREVEVAAGAVDGGGQ